MKKKEMAAALGISERSARKYELGQARVPRDVDLAITALVFNLPPWCETERELRQMERD